MEKNEIMRNKAQEFNDMLKEISQKLGLTDKQQIIGIEPKDNIKLGGNIERNSVFIVKIKNENGDISHIVIDKDINKIANIDKNGKVELSEREAKLWEQFIGTKGKQNNYQKQIYDFDKEYILEEYKTNEKNKAKGKNNTLEQEKDEEKANVTKDEEEAAESLGVDTSAIKSITKIEDRETFGQAINKHLEADSYIVNYGSNKTVIMQGTSNGMKKELAGLETSQFNSEVLEQLNIGKAGTYSKIQAGDLTTIKTDDPRYNYVVVKESDPNKGVVIVNSADDTKAYTFDDKDKDTIEELRTSIVYSVETERTDENEENSGHDERIKEENEKEKEEEQEEEREEEDEGRTPWGDAYARSHR